MRVLPRMAEEPDLKSPGLSLVDILII